MSGKSVCSCGSAAIDATKGILIQIKNMQERDKRPLSGMAMMLEEDLRKVASECGINLTSEYKRVRDAARQASRGEWEQGIATMNLVENVLAVRIDDCALSEEWPTI